MTKENLTMMRVSVDFKKILDDIAEVIEKDLGVKKPSYRQILDDITKPLLMNFKVEKVSTNKYKQKKQRINIKVQIK
jgi:hypothetical protein